MNLRWGWWIWFWLPVAAVAGETDSLEPNPALTVKSVLEHAVDRNPQRHLLQAMDGEVQARYVQARSTLPGVPAISVRHQNDALGSGRGEREWEAELELPLWLPGQRSARENVASGAQNELASSRDGLQMQVAGVLRDTIWDVAMNSGNVALARLRMQTAQELQKDVERRYQAGEIPRTDTLLAENESLQAQTALLRAETELRHAQYRYSQLSGMNEIPAHAEEPLSDIDVLDERHPLLREMDAKIALARSQRDLAQAERRENPQLMVGARSQRGAFDTQYNDSVGFRLRIPLATGVRSAPMLAAAETNIARMTGERERVRYAMETALHEAHHNLEVTRAELAVLQRQNELAQENLRLAQKAFKLGESDLVSLLRIRALAHEAGQALSSREVQLQWDIARYNQAVGVLPQ